MWTMPAFDAFPFFRFLLAVFVAAYTLIATGQFVREWHRDSMASAREEALVRRYLVVHVLRIRIKPFARDLLEIAALLAIFAYLVGRH